MIYLDNSSTTKINEKILKVMIPFLTNNFGNASSKYYLGEISELAINNARNQVMDFIKASTGNVVFTSGGSESNNLILKGLQKYLKNKGTTNIITTQIEHKSILNTCKYLESQGFEVSYLPINEEGSIDLKTLERAINSKTGLISVMYMNNEIGSVNNVRQIGEIAHKNNILFHSDCVQAAGVIPIDVDYMNIDFLSISGHKINAPKGIGCAYLRYPEFVEPLIHGGQQEFGIRAGTENVPYIVGIGKACELHKELNLLERHNMHSYFIKHIKDEIDDLHINGNPFHKIINVKIDGVDNEALMMLLAEQGVFVSTGSACNSHSIEPSYVLKSLGLSNEDIRSSIRISLPSNITEGEIDEAVEIISKSVKLLREI